MPHTKTKATAVQPAEFIAQVEPLAKRADAEALDKIFARATGQAATMWGPSIIGYGSYRYHYESGHRGRSARVGFSPRKAKHSLYLLGCGGEAENGRFKSLLGRLGKHTRGAGCLYVNKLVDIDLAVLEEMVALSWHQSFEDWPES